jgi:hypothetical protein
MTSRGWHNKFSARIQFILGDLPADTTPTGKLP